MSTVDFKKTLEHYRARPGGLRPLDVPDTTYPMVVRRRAGLLARRHDEFVPSHGLRMVGRHHEVYLSDARRVLPEKRRTILRQPVRPAFSAPPVVSS